MKMKFALAALSATVLASPFTMDEAYTSRQLSADAACGKDQYMTHTYEQFAEGFVPTVVLYDEPSDSQGFIGYMPSNNSIYIAFRGS